MTVMSVTACRLLLGFAQLAMNACWEKSVAGQALIGLASAGMKALATRGLCHLALLAGLFLQPWESQRLAVATLLLMPARPLVFDLILLANAKPEKMSLKASAVMIIAITSMPAAPAIAFMTVI